MTTIVKDNILINLITKKSHEIKEKNKPYIEDYKKEYSIYKDFKSKIANINKKIKSNDTKLSKLNKNLKQKEKELSVLVLSNSSDLNDKLEVIRLDIQNIQDNINLIKEQKPQLKLELKLLEKEFKVISKSYNKIKSKMIKNPFQDILLQIETNENALENFKQLSDMLHLLTTFCSTKPESVTIDFDIKVSDGNIEFTYLYLKRPEDDFDIHFSTYLVDINSSASSEYETISTNCINIHGSHLSNYNLKSEYIYTFFKNLPINDIHFETTVVESYSNENAEIELKGLYFKINNDNLYIRLNISNKVLYNDNSNLEGLSLSYVKHPTQY